MRYRLSEKSVYGISLSYAKLAKKWGSGMKIEVLIMTNDYQIQKKIVEITDDSTVEQCLEQLMGQKMDSLGKVMVLNWVHHLVHMLEYLQENLSDLLLVSELDN